MGFLGVHILEVKQHVFDMASSSNFFDVVLFFLSSLVTSPSFKFHVNIITGSQVLTIFFYKGLTRNPKIENTENFAQYLETRTS